MNVLAAPFLYTMPSELEAFFCFSKFIEESCPLYVQPTLEGVHRGLKVPLLHCKSPVNLHLIYFIISSLIDAFSSLILNCLGICDPKIYRQKYMLFHVVLPFWVKDPICLTSWYLAVLTLCACTPPLDQVLQLWDFLLAFGVHLNVLCVIAQLLLMRDNVMAMARSVN